MNVFRLDLSSLAFPLPLTTGEPVRCGGCGVFLNLFSKIDPPADAAQVSPENFGKEWNVIDVCFFAVERSSP